MTAGIGTTGSATPQNLTNDPPSAEALESSYVRDPMSGMRIPIEGENVPPFIDAAPLNTAIKDFLGEIKTPDASSLAADEVYVDLNTGLLTRKEGNGPLWPTLDPERTLALAQTTATVLTAPIGSPAVAAGTSLLKGAAVLASRAALGAYALDQGVNGGVTLVTGKHRTTFAYDVLEDTARTAGLDDSASGVATGVEIAATLGLSVASSLGKAVRLADDMASEMDNLATTAIEVSAPPARQAGAEVLAETGSVARTATDPSVQVPLAAGSRTNGRSYAENAIENPGWMSRSLGSDANPQMLYERPWTIPPAGEVALTDEQRIGAVLFGSGERQQPSIKTLSLSDGSEAMVRSNGRQGVKPTEGLRAGAKDGEPGAPSPIEGSPTQGEVTAAESQASNTGPAEISPEVDGDAIGTVPVESAAVALRQRAEQLITGSFRTELRTRLDDTISTAIDRRLERRLSALEARMLQTSEDLPPALVREAKTAAVDRAVQEAKASGISFSEDEMASLRLVAENSKIVEPIPQELVQEAAPIFAANKPDVSLAYAAAAVWSTAKGLSTWGPEIDDLVMRLARDGTFRRRADEIGEAALSATDPMGAVEQAAVRAALAIGYQGSGLLNASRTAAQNTFDRLLAEVPLWHPQQAPPSLADWIREVANRVVGSDVKNQMHVILTQRQTAALQAAKEAAESAATKAALAREAQEAVQSATAVEVRAAEEARLAAQAAGNAEAAAQEATRQLYQIREAVRLPEEVQ